MSTAQLVETVSYRYRCKGEGSRVNDESIWHFRRVRIEGRLACEFPVRQSSLDTVNRALEGIDRPIFSDFAPSYQDNSELGLKIVGAVVVSNSAPAGAFKAVSTNLPTAQSWFQYQNLGRA